VKVDAVATRHNMLRLKGRLVSLGAGVELLKGRRKALTREFMDLVEICMEDRSILHDLLLRARRALELQKAFSGEAIASLSHASFRELDLEIRKKNIWGVNVPEIREVPVVRRLEARGISPVGERSGLVETARDFERVVDRIIKMASNEVRATRIGEIIRSDTRKINAIDEVVLPAIRGSIKKIAAVLEEREREEVFRLKRYRSRKARRPGATPAP
jgi:V/A-type H+-transporting ATPase subunit D